MLNSTFSTFRRGTSQRNDATYSTFFTSVTQLRPGIVTAKIALFKDLVNIWLRLLCVAYGRVSKIFCERATYVIAQQYEAGHLTQCDFFGICFLLSNQ